jgi:hypothetical protein
MEVASITWVVLHIQALVAQRFMQSLDLYIHTTPTALLAEQFLLQQLAQFLDHSVLPIQASTTVEFLHTQVAINNLPFPPILMPPREF